MIDDLNDDSFMIYCAKAYDRPICILSEFEEDLKHIKYLKRLFKKYKASEVLKERLILNHIIVLYNVFGHEAATRILFLKIDREDWDVLKTFLLFLNHMPEKIHAIEGETIIGSDIPVNNSVAKRLREIV